MTTPAQRPIKRSPFAVGSPIARAGAFLVPFVLASVVWDHDGAVVGWLYFLLAVMGLWPLAFVPERAMAVSKRHPGRDGLLGGSVFVFPALILLFPDASVGTRIVIAILFGLALALGSRLGERNERRRPRRR